MAALKQLQEAHPKGCFWIKLDACDLKPALQESTRGEWNGDVDLGDGKLHQLRLLYDQRRAPLMSCSALSTRDDLEVAITSIIADLGQDIAFLADGLLKVKEEYQRKFNNPSSSKSILMTLCWERVEYNTLLQQAQSSKETYETMLCHLPPVSPRVTEVVRCLRNIKPDSLKYLRNLFIKMRQPAATHVLVSEEGRNTKPYALPIQYIPYRSIKDQYVMDVTNNIKTAMVAMGMKPVG